MAEDDKEKMEIFDLIPLEIEKSLGKRMFQQRMKLAVHQLSEDCYILLVQVVDVG